MFPESIPELEALYRASFDAAEKALKRFERIDSKTLLSTINQLRYAARHHLDSTVATSDAARRPSQCGLGAGDCPGDGRARDGS